MRASELVTYSCERELYALDLVINVKKHAAYEYRPTYSNVTCHG